MLYLDTSVLVAALTNEARTRQTQVWLGQQEPDDLVLIGWLPSFPQLFRSNCGPEESRPITVPMR
jgi:hypothetical protein